MKKSTKNLLVGAILVIICQFFNFANEKEELQNPSITIIDEKGNKSSLRMSELHIAVKVIGNLATTTMEMTFFNDLDRVLEGELNFPLADGQVISRFAMDIGGKLREGVVVEKAKGRQVFEDIVRHNIDPALLEQTKGNSFKSRVYPIPAKGSKKIVIAYENELSNDEEGMTYFLPMQYKDLLENFSLSVQVFSPEKPLLNKNAIPGINFEKNDNYFGANVHYKNYTADKQFEFMLPSSGLQKQVFTESQNGKTYFYLNFQPQIIFSERELPKKLCLLWDVSSSAMNRNIELEIDVLNKYFGKIGDCSVDLVLFSNDVEPAEKFDIINGNWKSLEEKLRTIPADGGTQFGSLELDKYNCDEFILSSDGISNFGEKDIKLSGKPVNILNSHQTAEHSYLKYIAQKTGGQYINLLNTQVEKAVSSLLSSPYSFISVEYSSGSIAETYPSISTPVMNNFTFSGILLSDDSEIKLNFGIAGKILFTETISVNKKENNVSSGMLSRIWASKKLSELDMRFEVNKDEITSIGKEFSIVTRNTSLIILDRIEDYVRYKIVPPDDLKQEYFAQLATIDERKQKDDSSHKLSVLNMFKKSVEWWNMDFSQNLLPKKDSVTNYSRNTSQRNSTVSYYDTLSGDTISVSHPVSWSILQGTVKDTNNQLLVGASVRINGTTRGGVVKANGRFNIINVPPGIWEIQIRCVSYKITNIPITIEPNRIHRINVILEKAEPTTDQEELMVLASRETVQNTEIGSVQRMSTTADAEEREGVTSAVGISSGVFNAGDGYIVRGSRGPETLIRVDGLDVGDRFTGGSGSGQSSVITDTANSNNIRKSAKIGLKKWEPDAPYLLKLKEAGENEIYSVYLELKKDYGSLPGFYLDVSDYFAGKNQKKTALRILSNLSELEMENHQLMRILAHRLEQLGYFKLAVLIFRDVLKIREEEPQSYRDLGLALELEGNLQEAADNLYKVAEIKWDSRFNEIELIALNELNNLISKNPDKIDVSKYDKQLIKHMPDDIRIVLNWDADNCDMDLWVFDPTGENCYYGHPATRIGGKMSRDFTQGYGPEEYIIKKAMPGKYKINVNYYGSRQQKIVGPTTIMMQIFTNYGKENEKKQEITLRLKEIKELIEVGEIEI